MALPNCKELLLDLDSGILTITLNRPRKRNAMNSRLVDEIMSVVDSVRDDAAVRGLIFRGAGGNFCSGGDISGMNREQQDEAAAAQTTRQLNRVFGRMITEVNRAPQIVVAVLEGAVMGGGLGLACVSDYAIADKRAMFAMPETGLGIIPAQIAPFVVARIGLTQARRLALLGERVDGEEAVRLGLAHALTRSEEALENELERVKKRIRSRAPIASASTKRLLFDVGVMEHEALLDAAADAFTAAMRGEEGQEGTAAFLQKRKPSWSAGGDGEQ
jgi:isohexenylglutaconyl-CoA hydratase